MKKISSLLIFLIVLIFGSFSALAVTFQKTDKTSAKNIKKSASKQVVKKAGLKNTIMPAGNYADLIVGEMSWIDHCPVPGDRAGHEGVLRINVSNIGKKWSENCYVKFTCQALSGGPCPTGINKLIPCSPIGTVSPKVLSWPPAGSGKWQPGKYRLIVEADYTKKVVESNETNNSAHYDFSVRSKAVDVPGSSQNQSVPPSGQAVVPALQPDIIIQNIEMTPESPSVGENIRFTVTFRNIGNGWSGEMHTRYSFYRTGPDGIRHKTNGNNIFDPKAIAPGEILEKSYVLKPYDEAQPHDYEVPRSGDTIDAVFELYATTLSVPESNDGNNKKTITFILK